MNRSSASISIVTLSLIGAVPGGCTSLINQNTDGNQVYTGVDSSEPLETDSDTASGGTGAEASASTLEGPGTSSSTSGGSDTTGEDTSGGNADTAGGGSSSGTGETGGDASTGTETGGIPGDDTDGEPIDGDPIIDPPGPVYAVSLALGWGSTYALLNTGEIKAWGYGTDGRLGYGNEADVIDPSQVGAVDVGFHAKQVVAGRDFACALAADGEPEAGSARCWGADSVGNLGRGFVDITDPAVGDDEPASASPLIQLESPIVALATGWLHTCALRVDQRVTCWGRGGQGQLGYGDSQNVGDDELPGAKGTVEVGWPVTTMWVGGHTTCLGNAKGEVRCFGEGLALGNASTENIGDDELPVDQPSLAFGFPIRQLAIGNEHMCALATADAGGQVACVGTGAYGKLGLGNVADHHDAATTSPVELPFAPAWLDAMHVHTCANGKDGETACFGWGAGGHLGYASTENIGDDEMPVEWGKVATGIDVVRVYTGVQHTCALSSSAQVVCWGWGYIGYPNIWWGVGDDEVPASVGLVPYL